MRMAFAPFAAAARTSAFALATLALRSQLQANCMAAKVTFLTSMFPKSDLPIGSRGGAETRRPPDYSQRDAGPLSRFLHRNLSANRRAISADADTSAVASNEPEPAFQWI